jgi:predicted nucleic acid-binding protein
MLYFLDTNVVSNFRKEEPNESLLAWLKITPEEDVCIPAPVIFEIQHGIERLRLEDKVGKAEQTEEWLDLMLSSRFGDNIIPIGLDSSRLQAKMFADPGLRDFLEQDPRSSKLKFGADLIISAMAIVHQSAIVSFDGDFLLVHERYQIPGLFHPGRGEWLIPHSERGQYR